MNARVETPLEKYTDWEVARDVARRQALRFGLSPSEADDVAQIVSLELFEQRERVHSPERWTYIVARRAALKLKKRRFSPLEPREAARPNEIQGFDLRLDALRAFGAQGEEAARIWWAHNMEGESWVEMAESGRQSLSTLKRRNRRVAHALQRRLAGSW